MWKAIKEHWESSPLVIALLWSWSILPNNTRFLNLGFIGLILLDNFVKWRYRDWSNAKDIRPSKALMRNCHIGLGLFLFLTPISSIAAYQAQQGIPRLLDKIVLKGAANSNVRAKVTAFSFGQGTPHPTNQDVAYLGVASANAAVMFESKPFFCSATARTVESVTSFGGVVLLLCSVAMFLFAGYERIVEFLHKRTVRRARPSR